MLSMVLSSESTSFEVALRMINSWGLDSVGEGRPVRKHSSRESFKRNLAPVVVMRMTFCTRCNWRDTEMPS